MVGDGAALASLVSRDRVSIGGDCRGPLDGGIDLGLIGPKYEEGPVAESKEPMEAASSSILERGRL